MRAQARELRVRAQQLAEENYTLWKAVRPMGFRGPAGDRYRRLALGRFRIGARIVIDMRDLAADLDRIASRLEDAGHEG